MTKALGSWLSSSQIEHESNHSAFPGGSLRWLASPLYAVCHTKDTLISETHPPRRCRVQSSPSICCTCRPANQIRCASRPLSYTAQRTLEFCESFYVEKGHSTSCYALRKTRTASSKKDLVAEGHPQVIQATSIQVCQRQPDVVSKCP